MRHATTVNTLSLLQQAVGLSPAGASQSIGAIRNHSVPTSNTVSNPSSCGLDFNAENIFSSLVNSNRSSGTLNSSSNSTLGGNNRSILGGGSSSSIIGGIMSSGNSVGRLHEEEESSIYMAQRKSSLTSVETCRTWRPSSELLLYETQQQQHVLEHPLLQQSMHQHNVGQQAHYHCQQPQQLGPQKREKEEQQKVISFVGGKSQRKQQKQMQKQRHNVTTVKAEVPSRASSGINTTQGKKSTNGGKTNNDAKGRSRSSCSRAPQINDSNGNNSSDISSDSNNNKNSSESAPTEGTEHVITPPQELQVTADYTLVSKGLVNMTYMQLEAARPPQELPPPEVGEMVESKAAHPDAQIFKARVVDRWQDPEHLWLFKLRSPDMGAPYLEPLKHVRKDNVWTLARELDLAGGRKARRYSSSFQQHHSGTRSSSCTPSHSSSASAASTGSNTKANTNSSTQGKTGGCASASAVWSGSSSASKKRQTHGSLTGGPASGTAAAASSGSRTALSSSSSAAAAAAGQKERKGVGASYSQREGIVGAATETNQETINCSADAANDDATFLPVAAAVSLPKSSAATSGSRYLPSAAPANPLTGQHTPLCRSVRSPRRQGPYTVASPAATAAVCSVTTSNVPTNINGGPSTPPLMLFPAAPLDSVPLEGTVGGPLSPPSSDTTTYTACTAANPFLPVACRAPTFAGVISESPYPVQPIAAVTTDEDPPASHTQGALQQPQMPSLVSHSGCRAPFERTAVETTDAKHPPPAGRVSLPAAAFAPGKVSIAEKPAFLKATAVSPTPTALAAAKNPIAEESAPLTIAPLSIQDSLIHKEQLIGCIAAETPQQNACKPLTYSVIVPELYLSPVPPPAATSVAGLAEEKEDRTVTKDSPLLRNYLTDSAPPPPDSVHRSNVTSKAECNTSIGSSSANTMIPGATSSQQVAAGDRCCSSSAELSLQFVSPPLVPPAKARSGPVSVSSTAAIPLGAAAAHNSWPPRADLLLKEGFGLHQQRLQRLFVATAAGAAAKAEQELQPLGQQQQPQQQQQHQQQQQQSQQQQPQKEQLQPHHLPQGERHGHHRSKQICEQHDVTEDIEGGGGLSAFLTPSRKDIEGANNCYFTSPVPAAAATSATVNVKTEELSRSIRVTNPSGSSLTSSSSTLSSRPSSPAGWQTKVASCLTAGHATTATAARQVLGVSYGNDHQQAHINKQDQPATQKVEERQQQLMRTQQREQEQQPQKIVCNTKHAGSVYSLQPSMKPRRSLPAYQRLERMLLLKQLVPGAHIDTVPNFPYSLAAVPCSAIVGKKQIPAARPSAVTGGLAPASVTLSSSPATGGGTFFTSDLAKSGAPCENGKGNISTNIVGVAMASRALGGVCRAAGSGDGVAASAAVSGGGVAASAAVSRGGVAASVATLQSERISPIQAVTTKRAVVTQPPVEVHPRNAAASAEKVAADVVATAAPVVVANSLACRLQKGAPPETKRFRRSSNSSSYVGVGDC